MTTAVFNYVDVDEPVDGLTSQQVNKLTCQLVNSLTRQLITNQLLFNQL